MIPVPAMLRELLKLPKLSSSPQTMAQIIGSVVSTRNMPRLGLDGSNSKEKSVACTSSSDRTTSSAVSLQAARSRAGISMTKSLCLFGTTCVSRRAFLDERSTEPTEWRALTAGDVYRLWLESSDSPASTVLSGEQSPVTLRDDIDGAVDLLLAVSSSMA
jgi:hypothetical protein